MFKKDFTDLTNYAYSKSQEKFKETDKIEANPFYIGFGNPNSDILIIGQEMAIDPEKSPETVKMESLQNPKHWKEIIDNNINDLEYSFDGKNGFKNPRKPYDSKAKNTWRSYEKIVEKIQEKQFSKNLEFFEHCFITEINSPVSKSQLGYKENEERETLIQKEFYKNFPIVIMATGKYANNKIENLFDVIHSKEDSDSQSQKRFEVYYSNDRKRVLVNTRQLSNFRFNGEQIDSYFQKIADKVK